MISKIRVKTEGTVYTEVREQRFQLQSVQSRGLHDDGISVPFPHALHPSRPLSVPISLRAQRSPSTLCSVTSRSLVTCTAVPQLTGIVTSSFLQQRSSTASAINYISGSHTRHFTEQLPLNACVRILIAGEIATASTRGSRVRGIPATAVLVAADFPRNSRDSRHPHYRVDL